MSKAASMFGGTGARQSNFFDGLMTLRQLVMFSSALTDCELAALYTPCHAGTSAVEPTEFEVDLLLGTTRYLYNVAYDSQRVHKESLSVYPHRHAQRWFSRIYDSCVNEEQWHMQSRHFRGARRAWQSATRARTLFLSVAARLDSGQLAPLVQWFEHCFDLCFESQRLDVREISAIIKDVASKNLVVTVLRGAGLSISDMRLTDGSRRMADQPMPSTQEVQGEARLDATGSLVEFEHTHSTSPPRWVSPPIETGGIYYQFMLAIRILGALRDEGLLLLDRFNTNLTPLLASYFLHLLIEPQTPLDFLKARRTNHDPLLIDFAAAQRGEVGRKTGDARRRGVAAAIAPSRMHAHDTMARRYILSTPHPVPGVCA